MEKKSYQMLSIIATPKLADKAAEMFKAHAIPIQYRINAEGTASSEIMDMLGLGSIDKCLLITAIPKTFGREMLKRLHSELKLDTVNSGIAFTISLNGASNIVLKMLTQAQQENVNDKKEENVMTESDYVLINAIVKRGFSGEVMNAARAAGARGGTVMHSRCIADENVVGPLGYDVQDETEIVLIIAPSEDKISIMKAITESCGVHSEANGIVMSLPIDTVMGL